MDVVSTIYKQLFNIKMLHSGFTSAVGSSIFSQINILPDTATTTLFNRYNIQFKFLDDTVAFFIQSKLASPPAKEPKTTFVKLDSEFKIRLLVFASTNFITHTYTVATGSNVVYYFHNRLNNVQTGSRYLNHVVDVYNASNSYDAGAIVNNSGEPFVSLQPVTGSDNISISNTVYWKKILPAAQVVNNADLQSTTIVEPDRTCFAVIDIFNTGTTNTTYNLCNGTGHLLSPEYVLSFKSKT